MAGQTSPITRLEDGVATLVQKAPGWIDNLFTMGTLVLTKYTKWVVIIGGLLAVSTVFQWKKKK